MEAKDTVKTYGELRTYCINAGLKEPSDYEIKTAQAEISFKVGREQEKQEWLQKTDPEKTRDNFTKQIIERAYAQGKKEAIEGIDIEFILNCLKQSKGMIWQRRGRGICNTQIQKLETLQAKPKEV